MSKISKHLTLLTALVFLGSSLAACSATKTEETPSKTEVKTETKSKAKETPAPSEEKETFKNNDQLSPQQNAIVKAIMEQNGYTQKTAEGILVVTDSVCNLLDAENPESIENQKTLKAIYDAPKEQSSQELQKWFINLKVATENICPEKQGIVLRFPPETLR